MGQYGQNHEVTVKDISDEKWRQSAKQVLTTLLKDSPADFSQTFDELVVVPDGILWYLPFEALQVTVGGQPQSLISRFHIRYAPTLSLCTPQGPARTAPGNTAVVVGKLYPHDADGVAKAAFEQLSGVVSGAVAIRSPLAGPFLDLRHALPPPDCAGRSRALRPGSLRLDFGAHRQGQDRGDAGRLADAALGRAERRHPPRLPHRRRRRPETPASRLGRQRSLPLRLRADGQRRANAAC